MNAPTAIDTQIIVQGTGSARSRVSGTGLGGIGGTNTAQSIVGKHIYVWVNNLDKVETKANGGWRIRVATSQANMTTNFGEWIVGGQETYIQTRNGFCCFCVDADRAFDFVTGASPNKASITSIAIVANHLTASTRETMFADAIWVGTGITVGGGTPAAPGTFAEVAQDDKTNGRGVVQDVGGAYYCLGRLTIGDPSGATSTEFNDSNQVLIFQDQNVSAAFHKIEIVGNATGTNNVTFGVEVGVAPNSLGSGGITVKAVKASAPVTIQATNVNINKCDMFGCSFINAGTIDISNTNVRLISCQIAQAGVITRTGGAELRDSTIDKSDTIGVQLDANPPDPDFRDMQIQNCTTGIRISAIGTYDFRNIKFAGNTQDVENNSGGLVTINVAEGGSTPTVLNTGAGSTTTVNNTKTLTVKCQNTAAPPVGVANVRVTIRKRSDDSSILDGLTDANGILTTAAYNFTVDTDVYVWARKNSTGDSPRYLPNEASGTITVNGFSTTITMIEDPVAV